MRDMDEETVTQLLQALRLAQTALDEGFAAVIENGAPVNSPLAQEFFRIMCGFRDSQGEFHKLIAQGPRNSRIQ